MNNRMLGYLLVLSAVYSSKHLHQFISDNPVFQMKLFFGRTIRMLDRLKPISKTLGRDQHVLVSLMNAMLRDESTLG